MAVRMFGRAPWWVAALMAVRDALVAPLGVRTSRGASAARGDAVGFFPVIGERPDRLVVGLDDRHLDFRVAVDVALEGEGCRVTATTLVRTHGRFGRLYLAVILPFHRLILRTMLKQTARSAPT